MKPTTLLWCATVVAACANIASPSADESRRLAEARALLSSDPHQALAVVDSLLATNPGLQSARLVLGEGSLLLARTDAKNAASLYEDAARNLELGLDGLDADAEPTARKQLAECQYELSRFEDASQNALRAAAAYAAQKEKAPNTRRLAAEAMLIAGRADLQTFVAARKQELDGGSPDQQGRIPVGRDTLGLALAAASRFSAARAEFPGEAATRLATIQQWLGQDDEVVRELESGLRNAPQVTEIHDAYITWMRERGELDALVGSYHRFVRENPSTPILRWHQGRAVYARADRLRQQGNFQGALAAYGNSDKIFQEYLGMAPSHADAANQWRALCQLAMCRTAVEMGDLVAAQEHLYTAAVVSPATTDYRDGVPQLVDSFGGHYTGAVFAIHRALSESADEALAKTLAFNESVLAQQPDRWGFVYNNAALAARDLGVAVAQRGEQSKAMELWERSYRYYSKAVELVPDDARIANDCGLMLSYHLNRDLDRARALFDRAIELGKAQLSALPQAETVPTEEREALAAERDRLEEAVGDAYQNIAVMMLVHERKDFATYRPFCEEAVKFYPRERREAAALLRSEGRTALDSTARSSSSVGAIDQPQGGAAEALAKQAAAIEQKRGAQDFDGALLLLDGIAKECRDHAPYHLLRGEVSSQLAVQARDSGRKGTQMFFDDAVRAFERAVELDAEPARPRQLLGQAQFDAGDLAGATATMSKLLLHLQSQGGGKSEDVLAAHTLRASAAARAYAGKKEQKQDDPELLTAARASFRLLEEKGQLDGAMQGLWSATEQWAGASAEAVNVYLRALQRTPDDQQLLDTVVNTAGQAGQLPLAIEALQKRGDATSLWYCGKARFWQADVERQATKMADAQKTLDAARADFQASMAKNTAFRDSCEQWQAMVLGKKGNLAFRSNDDQNAEKWLLESVQLRPDQIGTDLGLGETTKMGILLLADRFMKKNDLAKVEAIYRAASDAANSDSDLLNNSGLFARDHGNQLEQAGKKDAAMGMYEQSYKAYSRAHQLDPSNVRLRNDVALIAIYHLDRDWDLSKQRLDSAIADGEAMLRDNPPAEAEQKQQLDEAVGDCYENLALWHLKHSKDGALAKDAAQKSMRHYPGERRGGARRHLRAAEQLLQGK
ncbi:MAG: hypothetical protein MUC36_05295 [Planctomycetes bacterium]|jgi:hypothetical protein|nr:hypothetical protein [Planctomycetota bacterium]